jgi:hypothetical protein
MGKERRRIMDATTLFGRCLELMEEKQPVLTFPIN